MTNYIKVKKDTSFAEFKRHIDIVFTKYDYLYAFHFTGGEPLLCKELPEMIEYVLSEYGDKIWYIFCLSNGTVVPNERIVRAIEKQKFQFVLTDYTETANYKDRLKEVIAKLEENNISYNIGKMSNFVDLEMGFADYSHLNELELIQHHDDCNLFWHAFQNGKIYTCSYPSYAETAGLYKVTPDDYIDISSAKKQELLEFEFGYCNKGYSDLCKCCNGFGKWSKTIPFAEQIENKF